MLLWKRPVWIVKVLRFYRRGWLSIGWFWWAFDSLFAVDVFNKSVWLTDFYDLSLVYFSLFLDEYIWCGWWIVKHFLEVKQSNPYCETVCKTNSNSCACFNRHGRCYSHVTELVRIEFRVASWGCVVEPIVDTRMASSQKSGKAEASVHPRYLAFQVTDNGSICMLTVWASSHVPGV